MAKKKKRKGIKKEMRHQVKGILLIALAVFCYVGLVQTDQAGGLGMFTNLVLRTLAGDASLAVPFFIGILGLRLIIPGDRFNIKGRFSGMLILLFLYMIWSHLQLIAVRLPEPGLVSIFSESIRLGLDGQGGGVVGAVFAAAFYYLLGFTGSRILLFALGLISGLMVLNISLNHFLNTILSLLEGLLKYLKSSLRTLQRLLGRLFTGSRDKIKEAAEKRKTQALAQNTEEIAAGEPDKKAPAVQAWGMPSKSEPEHADAGYRDEQEPSAGGLSTGDNRNEIMPAVSAGKYKGSTDYIFPTLDLLNKPNFGGEQQHRRSGRERAKLLETTLQNFGVNAKVIQVQSGPTVTRFEVQPEAGVKVSKILNLSDDLALNLAAPLVRIEAPIPGKAALGIEVPNNVISLVYIREVIEENAYQNSISPLTVALGKDITGVPVIADMTKMPHLLIAGATGAGKSVCLNTLITSILYKAGPEQVRFMMIDPKVVELSVYNGIPHLLMPVLTDPRKASLALRNMVREMGRRYELFAHLGVRDITAYNELAAEGEEDLEDLPYIVVMIDELADLMYVSPGEVEDAIARLAQMSRAAGIHLIVATQRPSVDVLTGIIKANITSRIAFTVSSQFDSRTILDTAGAEKLLGRGDMLFYPVGSVKPFRVQGAYVSEAEVKRITDFIKEQGLVDYKNGSAFLDTPDEAEEEEVDALFDEAVDLVVRTGQASISLLQRRFRIGYTRAARLIDDLERRGMVGPFEGSKPREVLITSEQAAQIREERDCREE